MRQLYVNRLKNQHTDDLRAQDDQIRPLNVELKAMREEAEQHASELRAQVEQLNVTLERLRCGCKAGLLMQVAELQQKVRELGARRTLNQRRLGDANLDRQRIKVAQQQEAAARAALGEYGISMEAERAATQRADQLEKQARAPTLPTPMFCTLLRPCL